MMLDHYQQTKNLLVSYNPPPSRVLLASSEPSTKEKFESRCSPWVQQAAGHRGCAKADRWVGEVVVRIETSGLGWRVRAGGWMIPATNALPAARRCGRRCVGTWRTGRCCAAWLLILRPAIYSRGLVGDPPAHPRDAGKDSVIGVCIAMGGRRASPDRWQPEITFAAAWEPYPAEAELAKLTGLAVMRETTPTVPPSASSGRPATLRRTSSRSTRPTASGAASSSTARYTAPPQETLARSATCKRIPMDGPPGAGGAAASKLWPARGRSPTRSSGARSWPEHAA